MSNPLRALLIERINNLIERLLAGMRVPDKEIQMILSTDEWLKLEREIEQARSDNRTSHLPLGAVPGELHHYALLLKEADLLQGRASAQTRLGAGSRFAANTDTLARRAEARYSRALEYLAECLSVSPWMAVWLDRQANFEDHDCDLCSRPDGVPRLLNSRSQYARTPVTRSLRSLRIVALRAKLTTLEFGG